MQIRPARTALPERWILLSVTAACAAALAGCNPGSGIAPGTTALAAELLQNREAYGPGVFRDEEGSVRIESAQPHGGLRLQYGLDPGQRYRLSVRGSPLAARATLRIRRDDAEPVYLAAPEGSVSDTIRDTSRLELLVYADEPFAYRLAAVELEPCPSCIAGDELGATILAAPAPVAAARPMTPELLEQAEGLPGGQLAVESDGIRIDVEQPGGGAAFRYRLEPAQTYRVRVSGVPLAGSTTLRVRRDARPPTYGPAPSGTFERVVSAAEHVELLVYSDQPSSYRLTGIEIAPCSGCRTTAELRELAERGAPGIAADIH